MLLLFSRLYCFGYRANQLNNNCLASKRIKEICSDWTSLAQDETNRTNESTVFWRKPNQSFRKYSQCFKWADRSVNLFQLILFCFFVDSIEIGIFPTISVRYPHNEWIVTKCGCIEISIYVWESKKRHFQAYFSCVCFFRHNKSSFDLLQFSFTIEIWFPDSGGKYQIIHKCRREKTHNYTTSWIIM